MKNFWSGYFVGAMVALGCAGYQFYQFEQRAAEKEMQTMADSYFAGQEEATKACKGEMAYD